MRVRFSNYKKSCLFMENHHVIFEGFSLNTKDKEIIVKYKKRRNQLDLTRETLNFIEFRNTKM